MEIGVSVSIASAATSAPAVQNPAPSTQQQPVPVPTSGAVGGLPSGAPTGAAGKPEDKKTVRVEEQMLLGEDYERSVSQMMEMGFPRDQVVKAMKAAYNNPERATEYLLNVLSCLRPRAFQRPAWKCLGPDPPPLVLLAPQSRRQLEPPAPLPSQLRAQDRPRRQCRHRRRILQRPSWPAQKEGKAGKEQVTSPQVVRGWKAVGMGDIGQLRARILQDPGYLQQVIQEIQTTNPQLYQLIQQNPQAMLQMLMGAGGAPRRPAHGGIQVTPVEKAAIDRVLVLAICTAQRPRLHRNAGRTGLLRLRQERNARRQLPHGKL